MTVAATATEIRASALAAMPPPILPETARCGNVCHDGCYSAGRSSVFRKCRLLTSRFRERDFLPEFVVLSEREIVGDGMTNSDNQRFGRDRKTQSAPQV
jgi:hypothetical protein